MAKYVHELSHRLLTIAPLFFSKVLLVFTCHISQARVQAVGINSLTRNHHSFDRHSLDQIHQSVLDTLLPAVGAWAPCTAAGWALKVAAARPSRPRPRLLGGKPASRARHPTGRLGLLLFLIVFWSLLPCTGTCWRDRGGTSDGQSSKDAGQGPDEKAVAPPSCINLTYRNQQGDRASQLWPLGAESCSLYTDILFQTILGP
ncbi:hypothetical protein V8C40DRAFT_200620 [Trichoderma camerunense]